MIDVVASWYDPGNNGFDVGDAMDLVLIASALYGGMIAAAKIVRAWDAWKDRRHRLDVEDIMRPHLEALSALITETTRPIQPDTNGGRSLSDLHVKVDVALEETKATRDAVARVEERVEAVEAEQVAATAQREAILTAAEVNARAAQAALAELGSHVELIPLKTDEESP